MPSTSKLLEDPTTNYTVHLQEKEVITHDSRIFRFSLPSKDHVLGLPVGQHIHLSATINGEEVLHKYTPISSDDEAYGYFDLVIKVYFPSEPDHPKGGKLTQYLESLKVGDSIQVRGPIGRLTYDGCGNFNIKQDITSTSFNRVSYKKVGMIAGGTGIAPMYHLIQDVLKNPSDSTKLWLLFANHSEADILMRDKLESLAQQHPDRFKLFLTVTRAKKPEEWDGFVGHVNANMIKATLPPPSNDTLILMCGRKGFNEACHSSLDQLGYEKHHRFKY